MAAAHPHPGGQVPRLLWAVGEAHRRRRRGQPIGRPRQEPEVGPTTVPATDPAPVGSIVGAGVGAGGPALSVAGSRGPVELVVTGELGGVDLIDSQGAAGRVSAQTLLVSLKGQMVLRSPPSRRRSRPAP